MLKLIRDDLVWRFVLALVMIGCVFRFLGLETAMPGFFIDESGISSQIICLRQTGHDFWGDKLPLTSHVAAGGYSSPIHIYTGVLWSSVFGDSITSYRALLAFYSVLTLIGLFYLGQLLFRSRKAALLVALAFAISPWAFQFARIAWHSTAAPCFLVWACYFILRAEKPWHAALGGTLLTAAMYTYSPVRLHAVLLVPVLFWLKGRMSSFDRCTWKLAGIAAISGILVGIPLIQMVVEGSEFGPRAKMLSIFSDYYLAQFGGFSYSRVAQAFAENMLSFFKPSYLFISGDANLRHSTQSFGILSALDIFALGLSLIAFRMKSTPAHDRRVIGFLLAGYLFGLIPAALTWEGNPHSLRAFSAEPFLALLVGWILFRLYERQAFFLPVASLIAAVSLAALIHVHFKIYPERAAVWFDQDVATFGKAKKTAAGWDQFMNAESDYPRISRAYYLMAYGTGICIPESRRAP